MPGGKGPASSSDGDGFVSGNTGLIVLFAVVLLVFGGIVAANQAGLFDDEGGSFEGVASCDEVIQDGPSRQYHEHARLEVYLDSEQPYDFSQDRYQVPGTSPHVHFEGGNGFQVHVHSSRPTLGCLFETLRWSVSPDRIETDTGEVYEANGQGEIEILVGGEPADRGFNQPLVDGKQYVVRYTSTDDAGEDPGGNETGGNESGR